MFAFRTQLLFLEYEVMRGLCTIQRSRHGLMNVIRSAVSGFFLPPTRQCLNMLLTGSFTSHKLDQESFPPADAPLTSSVRDVSAVESCAFLPVENVRVLQQVQRGESVSSQRWEGKIQKAAHPFLQRCLASLRRFSAW